MDFNYVLTQITQPYFYYSVVLLAISLVCIQLLTKFCPFMRKFRSVAYLIPLVIPVFIFLIFTPVYEIDMTCGQSAELINLASLSSPLKEPMLSKLTESEAEGSLVIIRNLVTEVPSITGIVCLIGSFAAAFIAAAMLLGARFAARFLHIVELAPNEYPWLQRKVNDLSKKLSLLTPRIGLVEDLRPNAFTVGYGKKATLVFTIGILSALDEDELMAVASHELSHIKSHDFFFKAVASTLTALSFFNPLAHLSYSASQRARELLADERGAKTYEKPDSLANALTKISRILQTLPPERMLTRMSSNLFITSSILGKPQFLSTHPTLNQRLTNISEISPKHRPKPHKMVTVAFLTFLIIFATFTTTIGAISLQSNLAPPISPQDYYEYYPSTNSPEKLNDVQQNPVGAFQKTDTIKS